MKSNVSAVVILLLITVHSVSAQSIIGLDNWYNREVNTKTNQPYHYLWSDKANSGFSQLGTLFTELGATLQTIETSPCKKSLGKTDIYVIVDPDTPKESANPNYIQPEDIRFLTQWVKKGGVLLLMANDGPNCEFTHLNQLAGVFGFRFNEVTLNPVVNRNWEMGAETHLPNHPLFAGVNKIYLKEVASITLTAGAKPVLIDGNDIFIAEASYGKGYVLAIGDPWLYNEYIDHALLPESFENLKAARNLAEWLISKTLQK